MKLNIKKIETELKRIDKTWWWLSKELKTDWQKVRYWRDKASLAGADPIAKILHLNPRDLVK